jgi:hypothetical protein
MTTHKFPSKKEPFRISSFALTSSTETILKRLSQDATDVIGRSISESAIVRALLRSAGQQPTSWAREHVYPCLETEMNVGMLWERKKSERLRDRTESELDRE